MNGVLYIDKNKNSNIINMMEDITINDENNKEWQWSDNNINITNDI